MQAAALPELVKCVFVCFGSDKVRSDFSEVWSFRPLVALWSNVFFMSRFPFRLFFIQTTGVNAKKCSNAPAKAGKKKIASM